MATQGYKVGVWDTSDLISGSPDADHRFSIASTTGVTAGPTTSSRTVFVSESNPNWYRELQPAPNVTSISPDSGPNAGGGSVTITGTDLTGATSVTIGGNACTDLVVVNATTITCTVPAGTSGAKDVVVTTGGGNDTLPGGYTYVPEPAITSSAPMRVRRSVVRLSPSPAPT